MTHSAGLDVSLEETAICVVDATGMIVKEMRAESEPRALDDGVRRLGLPLERVGMEACSLAAWLHDGLTAAGWPAVCIETRQAAPHHGADHADRMVPPGARQKPAVASLALASGGAADRAESHTQH